MIRICCTPERGWCAKSDSPRHPTSRQFILRCLCICLSFSHSRKNQKDTNPFVSSTRQILQLSVEDTKRPMPNPEKHPRGAPAFPAPTPHPKASRTRMVPLVATALFLLAITFYKSSLSHVSQQTVFQKVQQCAIDNLKSDLSFLHSAVPISSDEFIERRDRLARALAATGVDAFVLEPGYTFQ